MNRDLASLTDKQFDLVIIGGGIFGACAAREAAVRGLSVALIEREDFASGASANSFRMVHGGIRYLQHLDLPRLRESCFERAAFLRTAPHLVQPLPIVTPTFGIGRESRWFLGTGMFAYDLLTLDRNRAISDESRKIPGFKLMGRSEVRGLFPGFDRAGLTGAAVFHDAQMYNQTRLVLAFVQSAVMSGAKVANYTAAESFLREKDQIVGVKVRDVFTNDEFDIRARMVLNTAGPWTEPVLREIGSEHRPRAGVFSRDASFVVPRKFDHPYALAVPGLTSDPDAKIGRSARHLFIVPWREYSLVGVWHRVWDDHPDNLQIWDAELEEFIDEFGAAYPGLGLTLDQVSFANYGLVPFGEDQKDGVNLSYGKRSRLIDHERETGLAGLVSLVGIRYTMGRGDAARAVQLIIDRLGIVAPGSRTHLDPVFGGDIESFDSAFNEIRQECVGRIPDAAVETLLRNYGSAYGDVLRMANEHIDGWQLVDGNSVMRSQIRYAVRNEMAKTLADVVLRRTDLGTGGRPSDEVLKIVTEIMAAELGWTKTRATQERTDLANFFDTRITQSRETSLRSGVGNQQ